MKKLYLTKIFLLLSFINTLSFADISNAYAIGIFDETGNGENIQKKRKTEHDYNGTCFTKIVVLGSFNQIKPKVTINNSIGHFQKEKSIYNKNRIKIGSIITYKHFNIKSGYIRVSYENKLFDTKVFVK